MASRYERQVRMLTKLSRTADKGLFSIWGLCMGLLTPHIEKPVRYEFPLLKVGTYVGGVRKQTAE